MKFRLTERAQADIDACLDWSLSEFGSAALLRYQRLIKAAIRDVAKDPLRHGSRELVMPDDVYRLYHLRFSRTSASEPGPPVRTPRHFLAFRVIGGDMVEIVRLLHDSMDIENRLSS